MCGRATKIKKRKKKKNEENSRQEPNDNDRALKGMVIKVFEQLRD